MFWDPLAGLGRVRNRCLAAPGLRAHAHWVLGLGFRV